jgi:Rrf2 family protein
MLSIKAVAEGEDIPRKFLEAILLELKRHHLVDSKRGIFGGYFLARPAEEIMLGTIIRIMDGPLAPVRCASVTAYERCEDCHDEAHCSIRTVMLEVRNAIAGVLDHKPLSTLQDSERLP